MREFDCSFQYLYPEKCKSSGIVLNDSQTESPVNVLLPIPDIAVCEGLAKTVPQAKCQGHQLVSHSKA